MVTNVDIREIKIWIILLLSVNEAFIELSEKRK